MAWTMGTDENVVCQSTRDKIKRAHKPRPWRQQEGNHSHTEGAQLLHSIERGAPWPAPVNIARTAFLSKGEDDLSPLGSRGLSILSKFYRLYASIRLRHFAPWIANWQSEDLFAGTNAPVGAEDSWFLSAMLIELAKLEHVPATGSSMDIFKCFGQILM
jgi:hypothetical protein